MEDEVHGPFDCKRLRDILTAEFEFWIAAQVFDISFGTSQEVVERDHGHSFGQKAVAHVRADEAGGSGYDGALHSAPPCETGAAEAANSRLKTISSTVSPGLEIMTQC